MTISPVAGDGVGSPALRANIQLADSGNTVGVQGIYYPGKKDHHKRVTTERPHPTGGAPHPAGVGPPPGGTRKGEVDSDSLFRVFRWIPWLISDRQVAGNVTLFSQTLPSTAPTAISQQGNFFFPCLGTVSPN